MTGSPGLARVTVSAPRRRLDVALPEHAPLAELLPELLRQAGEELANAGTGHGGWVLRRVDGSALDTGTGLGAQGVHDGAVLHLAPAVLAWPELEYDDVVDAVAAGARRYGRPWDAAATRLAGLGLTGLALAAGLAALVRAGTGAGRPGLVALAVAAALLAGGTVASRAYADAVAGAALAGYALPYALAGAVLAAGGPVAPANLLPGAAALLLASVLGAVGVGHALRIFVAGTVAGLFGAAGALLGYGLPAAGAAAIVLAAVVTSLAGAPLLAVRLGKVPLPVLGPAPAAVPGPGAVFAAVVRADELLTGLLAGAAVTAVAAAAVVAAGGGVGGRVLVAVAATVLALRARLFPTVRGRLPLLLAGVAGYLVLLVAPVRAGTGGGAVPVAAALVLAAVVPVLAGSAYRHRAPGPYLGRAADLLDALCVIAVIPAACAVLGLYGALRALAG